MSARPKPAPARSPCTSCPYRRDVPSGVWAAEEYAKLPRYDADTAGQPVEPFFCHQQAGRICAGWAGCHDMYEALSVRLAAAMGKLTGRALDLVLSYVSPVPLHPSGRAAADHGLRDVLAPGAAARAMSLRLAETRARRT